MLRFENHASIYLMDIINNAYMSKTIKSIHNDTTHPGMKCNMCLRLLIIKNGGIQIKSKYMLVFITKTTENDYVLKLFLPTLFFVYLLCEFRACSGACAIAPVIYEALHNCVKVN